MKFTRLGVLLSFIFAGVAATAAFATERTRTSFDLDWRFQRGDPTGDHLALDYATVRPWLLPLGAEFTVGAPSAERPAGNLGSGISFIAPSFDDANWRAIDLPHDWAIEGPFDQALPGETGKLPWSGVGWYRKRFIAPALAPGERLSLQFDGAMANALVWCNGQFVGGWPFGYTSWQVNLNAAIKPGAENVIAVRLQNLPDSTRWYPGSGLYRHVWLETTSPIHVAQWGVALTTPVITAEATTIGITVELRDDTGDPAAMAIRHHVWEKDPALRTVHVTNRIFAATPDGRRVGAPLVTGERLPVGIHDGYAALAVDSLTLPSPKRWSLESPTRYVVETTVHLGAEEIDRVATPFGVRTAVFTADQGFLLNGQRVRLQGVCLHHDLGALGAAVNFRALERRLELLQAMGCNAIRTSHNPPAPELLELCDRMGFVVMDEAFDSWTVGKKPNDYHRLFADWHEKDLKALIRRDRNHPSVVLWSIGNEVGEQTFPEPWKWGRRLTALAREEDPTRPTTSAYCVDDAAAIGLQTAVEVMGFNYRPHLYADFRRTNPAQAVVGSETASTLSSRGEYFFPSTTDKAQGRANFQVSSYDLNAGDWATTPDAEFLGQDDNPAVAGEFVWTGFDYLGESTPYLTDATAPLTFTDAAEQARHDEELRTTGKITVPSRSSYFGILDLAGFPKDRYYLYQARWRPELRMAHLLPHWNWPERVGQIAPVHVYSSADEAELFLNGRSLGRKQRGPREYRFRWEEVRYEPGELKVVTYKQGAPWATATRTTTGPAAKLQLTADRTTLQADGHDLAFVTVAVVDARGDTVPRDQSSITFTLEGPGRIVAVDNGDPTSHASFQASLGRAFNGLISVVVRTARDRAGALKLTATSDGLITGEALLVSVTPPTR